MNDGWIYQHYDGWVDGWMGGWMDKQMDVMVDGWRITLECMDG